MKVTVLILLATMASFTIVPSRAMALTGNQTINPRTLVALTNTERILNGRLPLKENKVLDQIAKLRAEDMINKNYFSHNSPEGKLPWYWFGLAGYKFTSAGENLAVLFEDPNSIIEGWMSSPTHRANILKNKFTEIGMAVVAGKYNGVDTNYVVEVFGNPAPSKALVIKNVTTAKINPA